MDVGKNANTIDENNITGSQQRVAAVDDYLQLQEALTTLFSGKRFSNIKILRLMNINMK